MRRAIFPTVALLSCLWLISACSTQSDGSKASLPLSDRPLTGKFAWHDLITDDVSAAKRFYGGLFNWTFESTTRATGEYTLIIAQGRYMAGFVELDDPSDQEYSRWLGYISLPDVDASVERTEGMGGQRVAGPVDLGDIARAAVIIDPQGAAVGLVKSMQGDPKDIDDPGMGHIVWNELLAADAQAAAEFYANLTGLEARTINRRGGEYRMLRDGAIERAGVLQRPGEDIDPTWITHFAVNDVQSATARARQLGGKILLAPAADYRDGRQALVEDPNGAVFALWQLENGE